MSIRMLRHDGSEIADADRHDVAVNDFLLMGGDDVLKPVIPHDGFSVPTDTQLVRDALLQWFSDRSGSLDASMFYDLEQPRWNLPEFLPASCGYQR